MVDGVTRSVRTRWVVVRSIVEWESEQRESVFDYFLLWVFFFFLAFVRVCFRVSHSRSFLVA